MKAVVFDFYGTLAETRDWGPSWEQLVAEMGYELDPDLKERWWNDGIDGIEHDEHSRSRDALRRLAAGTGARHARRVRRGGV